MKLLFDGDMVVFRASSAVEFPVNWKDDLWILYADAADAKEQVDAFVEDTVNAVLSKLNYEGSYDIIMCFTCDHDNFRKKILPTYKDNRKGKMKPICYGAVRDWVRKNYFSLQRNALEADDLCGILSTRFKDDAVVISGDKDFRSIPGYFYDFIHGDLIHSTVEEANYWHLIQTLAGDTADNYKGCPGIGIKRAEKLLKSKGATWDTVVRAFKGSGCTEEDALVQARVSYILRNEDFKDGKVRLWTPRRE